jgi:glycosyltransferase involved in cell wall biosynthesis
MPKISVTILVKNGEKHIERVLQALKEFDEVAILDTGSSDATLDIASKFANVSIHKSPFLGFGKSHNLLSSLAKHDWILSIDADEVVTKELANEIFSLSLKSDEVYSFWRKNFYRGKWIKGCGWYPDRVFRLYNRTKTSFSNAEVHEAINTKGLSTASLQGHIEHYPYETVSDFLTKMQSYSTLFAKQYAGKKKSSIFHALGHGLFAVIKSYFLKKGFLLGHEGFVISLYNGHTAYYKYLKLQEQNNLRIL